MDDEEDRGSVSAMKSESVVVGHLKKTPDRSRMLRRLNRSSSY